MHSAWTSIQNKFLGGSKSREIPSVFDDFRQSLREQNKILLKKCIDFLVKNPEICLTDKNFFDLQGEELKVMIEKMKTAPNLLSNLKNVVNTLKKGLDMWKDANPNERKSICPELLGIIESFGKTKQTTTVNSSYSHEKCQPSSSSQESNTRSRLPTPPRKEHLNRQENVDEKIKVAQDELTTKISESLEVQKQNYDKLVTWIEEQQKEKENNTLNLITQQNEDHKTEIQKLYSNFNRVSADYENQAKFIKEISTKNDQKEKKNQELRRIIEEFEKQKKSNDEEMNQIKQKIQEQEKIFSIIQTLERSQISKEEEINQMKKKIQEQERKFSIIQELEKRQASKEEEINQMKRKIQELGKTSQVLENQNDNKKQEVDQIRRTIQGQAKTIQEFEQKQKLQEERIRQNEVKIGEQEKIIRELDQKQKKLKEEQIYQNEEKIQKQEKVIRDLEKQQKYKEQEINRTVDHLKESFGNLIEEFVAYKRENLGKSTQLKKDIEQLRFQQKANSNSISAQQINHSQITNKLDNQIKFNHQLLKEKEQDKNQFEDTKIEQRKLARELGQHKERAEKTEEEHKRKIEVLNNRQTFNQQGRFERTSNYHQNDSQDSTSFDSTKDSTVVIEEITDDSE